MDVGLGTGDINLTSETGIPISNIDGAISFNTLASCMAGAPSFKNDNISEGKYGNVN
jgi:hypothetical protein